MRLALLWVLLLTLTPRAAAAGRRPVVPPPDAFHRGMTLGLFSEEDPEVIGRQLDEMQQLGIDAVSLVVPKVIADVRSLDLRDARWVTPTDAALRTAMQGARRRGMRVMLFPILFVEDLSGGEWRGSLKPADWDAWFGSYGEMILGFARMAEEERVDLLSVGSELLSSEGYEVRWRALIREVRRVYSGKLLYSANWDHFQDIPFLDALDYVGVNAYYHLTDDPRPEVSQLVDGWKPIRDRLLAWARSHRRPLLFTEVGYPSREGAAGDPWDYTADRPVSLEVQRRCYRAFIEAWRDVPELAGVFFYVWWGEGGEQDRDYTPRNKPAAGELQRWFAGAAESARRE